VQHEDPRTDTPNRTAVLRTAHGVALLLAVLAVAFIAQNRNRVTIDVFWLQVVAPLWLTLLLTAVVGLLVGLLGSRRRQRSRPR
jgi:putative membrane protein